jgi:hypothetical protein
VVCAAANQTVNIRDTSSLPAGANLIPTPCLAYRYSVGIFANKAILATDSHGWTRMKKEKCQTKPV